MTDLPLGIGRTQPKENATETEKRRYQRLVSEELQRRDRIVAGKVAGDAADEIEVTSLGEDQEIRIANTFPFVPDRFEVTAKGSYQVGKSQVKLADESFIYLTSDADVGEKFTVRFWRR